MSIDQQDPHQYQLQLDNKVSHYRLSMQQAGVAIGDIAVHRSEPLGLRMRAEFRVWQQDGQVFYAMNRPGEKRPYIIEGFAIGAPLITQTMPRLLQALNSSPVLSRKCFSAEFLTTSSGQVLISLIYHRPLDSEWEAEARVLQEQLGAGIIGRSRKQKVVLDKDYVTEQLIIEGRDYC